jgi:hypothetical protein
MNSVTVRVVLVLACSIPSATLWGSQAWGTQSISSPGVIVYPVDASRGDVGEITRVSTGLPSFGMFDLAAHAAIHGRSVWVVRGSGDENDLVAVDPYRQDLLSRVTLNAPEPIVTLAIDPTTGEFYGTSDTALYRISSETGATTLVGATSLAVDEGLGFDRQGNLYGIANENQLVEINKTDAGTSLRATLDVFRMDDIAARPEDGLMYGVGYGPSYSLYQIDLSTGDLVNLGDSLLRPSGLAFSAVPEPSTVSLGLAALVLLTGKRLVGRRL